MPLTSALPQSTTADWCTSLSAVATYQFPNNAKQVGTYRINAKTGLLTWDVPTELGSFSIAIVVSEWRYGQLISETHQELLLTVVDKGGTPITPPPYEPAYVGVLTATDDRAPDALQLTVSPNPSMGGVVQVSLQNRLGLPAVFSVLDNQGRVHQHIEKNQVLDQQGFQLDLSNQPAGLYFIRAESGGRQVVRKLVRE
ncbi:T9SS type A sorting domain-containing protein [Fibrella aquatilis]|uniref:T9SS type A sorting domain-containing protein n=1 Tax=Fibrella aquatilis TaxID=2817059 RepID=A0A939GA04_9BACT|nr:T9SS type A sorting domain-containing protein [Fibrella aquatilis]MBO0933404.1 T9SS type A sorting domain-containing protein [Fibrella aquatilis]